MTDQVYTVKEVAEHLKCSVRKATELCTTGELVAFKVGKIWRVRESAIENFKASTSNEKVVAMRAVR